LRHLCVRPGRILGTRAAAEGRAPVAACWLPIRLRLLISRGVRLGMRWVRLMIWLLNGVFRILLPRFSVVTRPGVLITLI
jgi:hypothetical protein